MRTALISLAGQPMDAVRGGPLTIAGKTLAHRQLDFALAAGCENVVAVGDGASPEAIALRHAAEGAGTRFQAIPDSHGLLGAVRAQDELLVLAPGLLPEATEALDALGKGRKVLVLPAGPGVAAGFERIDLNRAWGGALVVDGGQVERLADLAADTEPASALMRIAMQARVPERPLPEHLLADGSWSMLAGTEDRGSLEGAWLKRYGRAVGAAAPTEWFAQRMLSALASRLLATPHAVAGLVVGAMAALAGSLLMIRYDQLPLGFALVMAGALLSRTAAELARLRRAPFGRAGRSTALLAALPWLVDGTIFAAAVLAIEGTWLHRLFPSMAMLGILYTMPKVSQPDWAALPRDRGLLAAVLAIAGGFGLIEPAVMAVSLLLVGLNLAQSRPRGG